MASAQQGTNVLIWFAANLRGGGSGSPEIEFGLNVSCIAATAAALAAQELPTTHLLSVGGWNAPHPNTSEHLQRAPATRSRAHTNPN